MDYRINCVCGHSFLVPQDQVKGVVTCPACQSQLKPVVQDAPKVEGDLEGEVVSAEETKRCPYCGEVILAIARKCKHCGEFLDREMAPHAGGSGGDASAQAAAVKSLSAPGSTADAAAAANTEPKYVVSVSQWDNFWKFTILVCALLLVCFLLLYFNALRQYALVGIPAVLVIIGFIGAYFYLAAQHTRYYIRPLRIDSESGILSKDMNSLELFRITDMELKQGIIERILGIGTIKLMTSESATPELILFEVPQAREVFKYIQTQIPVSAKMRGAIYMEK